MKLKEKIEVILTEAIREVLTTLVSLTPEIRRKSGTPRRDSEKRVVVSMGLAGPLSASLALVWTNRSACTLVSKMLGSKMTDVNQDVVDGLGEFANIMAGRIKYRFQELSYPLALSLPGVILGLNSGFVAKMRASESISLIVNAEELNFETMFLYAPPDAELQENWEAGEGVPQSLEQEASEALQRLLSQKKKK